ncbi:MAG TPA: diaminopimelate epimerase [Deltaproteobacteria bacterium]|nr:diaminopimelate epimerase [Deltaproteobacteria bacterium]HPP80312.1 diaminopimelate epimerase [Deltaproteobacteria bacterium]
MTLETQSGGHMETITFTKMSGAGNDFIMIDACSSDLHLPWSEKAASWCRLKTGIGADGLIVIAPHEECDFTMRIFNSDGSEADMCGNGARCAALFARMQGLAGPEMRFMTKAGVIGAKVRENRAAIEMTEPRDLACGMSVQADDEPLTVHFVNTGVPHAVLFTRDLDAEPVADLGRRLRYHELFAPTGTNVDFVEAAGGNVIRVRTYERGVEAETLACGTGAVASAIVSHRLGMVQAPPITVKMPGGDLAVDFAANGSAYTSVWLDGPVDVVFKGEIDARR